MLKLVFVGSSGVGKDALVSAIKGFEFSESYIPTPGPSFNFEDSAEKDLRLNLVTTPGKKNNLQRYTPLSTGTADMIFFVYDITRLESYDELPEWIELATVPDNAIKVILGNKKDLEDQRQVSEDEARKFAEENGALYFEVSAKENTSIKNCVQNLINLRLGLQEKKYVPVNTLLLNKIEKLRNYADILEELRSRRPLLKDPIRKIEAIKTLLPENKMLTKKEISEILENPKHVLLQNRTKLPFSVYSLMSWMCGRTNPLLKNRPCESRTEWRLVKILKAFPEEALESSELSSDNASLLEL